MLCLSMFSNLFFVDRIGEFHPSKGLVKGQVRGLKKKKGNKVNAFNPMARTIKHRVHIHISTVEGDISAGLEISQVFTAPTVSHFYSNHCTGMSFAQLPNAPYGIPCTTRYCRRTGRKETRTTDSHTLFHFAHPLRCRHLSCHRITQKKLASFIVLSF